MSNQKTTFSNGAIVSVAVDPADLKSAAREIWRRIVRELSVSDNVLGWRSANEEMLQAISHLTGFPVKMIFRAAAEIAMMRRILSLRDSAEYFRAWFETNDAELRCECHLGNVLERYLTNSWHTKPIHDYAWTDEEKNALAQFIEKGGAA